MTYGWEDGRDSGRKFFFAVGDIILYIYERFTPRFVSKFSL